MKTIILILSMFVLTQGVYAQQKEPFGQEYAHWTFENDSAKAVFVKTLNSLLNTPFVEKNYVAIVAQPGLNNTCYIYPVVVGQFNDTAISLVENYVLALHQLDILLKEMPPSYKSAKLPHVIKRAEEVRKHGKAQLEDEDKLVTGCADTLDLSKVIMITNCNVPFNFKKYWPKAGAFAIEEMTVLTFQHDEVDRLAKTVGKNWASPYMVKLFNKAIQKDHFLSETEFAGLDRGSYGFIKGKGDCEEFGIIQIARGDCDSTVAGGGQTTKPSSKATKEVKTIVVRDKTLEKEFKEFKKDLADLKNSDKLLYEMISKKFESLEESIKTADNDDKLTELSEGLDSLQIQMNALKMDLKNLGQKVDSTNAKLYAPPKPKRNGFSIGLPIGFTAPGTYDGSSTQLAASVDVGVWFLRGRLYLGGSYTRSWYDAEYTHVFSTMPAPAEILAIDPNAGDVIRSYATAWTSGSYNSFGLDLAYSPGLENQPLVFGIGGGIMMQSKPFEQRIDHFMLDMEKYKLNDYETVPYQKQIDNVLVEEKNTSFYASLSLQLHLKKVILGPEVTASKFQGWPDSVLATPGWNLMYQMKFAVLLTSKK